MAPERRKEIQAAKRERMKELVEKLRASQPKPVLPEDQLTMRGRSLIGSLGSAYKDLFVGITSIMHHFITFIGFGGPEIDRLVADHTVELGLSGLCHNDTSLFP